MLPFLKIEIVLPGDNAAGDKDKKVVARIQPDCIETYNDAYYWGCLIKMKSGEIIMTPLNAAEFEMHLLEYWKRINEQINRPKPNLSIIN